MSSSVAERNPDNLVVKNSYFFIKENNGHADPLHWNPSFIHGAPSETLQNDDQNP